MLVNLDLYFDYFLFGLFLTWIYIYIQLQPPVIYELSKEKFENKCF